MDIIKIRFLSRLHIHIDDDIWKLWIRLTWCFTGTASLPAIRLGLLVNQNLLNWAFQVAQTMIQL